MREGNGRSVALGQGLLWGALTLFLVAMLVVIVALALAVRITGNSMEPTLASGDRVVRIPGAEFERFDLIESTLAQREIPVVKRVIALPGDRVQVSGGPQPRVLVWPDGEESAYVVDNPAWPARFQGSGLPCCEDDGTSLLAGDEPVPVVVPPDHYWVLGDNWGASDDSRTYGFVATDQIAGRLWLRLSPRDRFGRLAHEVELVEVVDP